jgi:hypothetical protein
VEELQAGLRGEIAGKMLVVLEGEVDVLDIRSTRHIVERGRRGRGVGRGRGKVEVGMGGGGGLDLCC